MPQGHEQPGQSARRLLVAASTLEAMAAVLWLAGRVLGTIAIATVAQQRVARMEAPPSELVRRTWARARAARSAD